MKPVQLTVARIGNSRGVRIPAVTLKRFNIGDRVIMEEREDGILLRPLRSLDAKLSWDDTARSMAQDLEDWSDLDETLADGLEQLPWEGSPKSRVAERAAAYESMKPKAKRSRR